MLTSAVADTQTSWEGVSVASTGNTAPSIAAYTARAGIPCAVVVPEETSLSKLTQVAAHDVNIYSDPAVHFTNAVEAGYKET